MTLRFTSIFFFFIAIAFVVAAHPDSSATEKKREYQIYLKKPAKSIKLLMYDKTFLPVQGRLSEDGKKIILKDYEKDHNVRVKIIYLDGSVGEFISYPCFIDPVIS